MVHTCAKCGKVYPDSSAEILIGCSQCGGKKFYFERPGARKKKTPEAEQPLAAPSPQPAPVKEKPAEEDRSSRVESIRIVAPGTYELNIEKMARSDDRVVGLGREGSYAVDLLSMAGAKKKKKSER
jgi:predicted  nucleic acid-binding Zn-ribbon protein